MSIVCFGEALIDFLSDGKMPESFTKYAGGAPANVAVAAAKLGVPSSFCGMLGDDMFGQFLLQELTSLGVNTQYCRFTTEAKTALAFVSLDQHGERSFSFYRPPAADLLFRAEDFAKEMFETHKVLHVCSNSLTENNIYKTTVLALQKAKEQGMLRSFDMNLRENLWQSTRHLLARVWHVMALSDIVKLSQEELTYLNHHSHTEEPEEHTIHAILGAGVKLLVITNGSQPIRYFTASLSGQVDVPKVKAVDTTAAGDAFVGGLLAKVSAHSSVFDFNASLNHRTQIEAWLEFASRCGAFAVTKKGAFASLPTQQDMC
ncbi:carbohydrate kinase [Pseudoalteromonas fenneropenaei]|uniref:Carbohydrate kinase n=1 Tax=Pseudoalteromonas fenneropenaei TaxID=1737459 RepID=A0ABV7CIP5_9GAMM